MFRIEIPLHLVNGANERTHWSVRKRRASAHRAACVVVPKGDYLPCVVTITRIGPRALDTDGLAISAKHVRDGIADRLGINDNDPRCRWEYRQRKGKPKQYAVEIEIAPDPPF